jgi:antitoxin component YwqK of YwqJK toxin-antitoxin module
MKNLAPLVLGLTISSFLISCENKQADVKTDSVKSDSVTTDSIKTNSVVSTVRSSNYGDTVNRVDANGLKQGYWIITGNMLKDEGYADDAVETEGRYVNGKEEGKWIQHAPDGKVIKETSFKTGVIVSDIAIDNKKNYTDASGKKQGYWELTGAMLHNNHYKPDAVVESGIYVDDEKDGLWTTYNPDGSVQKTISIKNRGK